MANVKFVRNYVFSQAKKAVSVYCIVCVYQFLMDLSELLFQIACLYFIDKLFMLCYYNWVG